MNKFTGPAIMHAGGFEIPEPYYVMNMHEFNYLKDEGSLSYSIYYNQEAYEAGKRPIDGKSVDTSALVHGLDSVALTQTMRDALIAYLSA